MNERTVVTGRGLVENQYKSDVYEVTTGTRTGTVLSPYDLNYTVTFKTGRAYCICNISYNTWALIRFNITESRGMGQGG